MCKRLALLPGGFFSRMRSKGSRFTDSLWGSGVEGVFARRCVYVRNGFRVRANMAVPIVSSAKGVTFGPFGGFKRCVASCRVAGVALCDIPTRFIMCQKYSKVVLCGRRDTFATFSHDELHFSWQMQHFGDLHRYFEWQVQHFRRVMLRVFCELPLSGLRQVVFNVQNPWQEWHFVRCAENCRKPRMKHRFRASWV